MVKKHLHRFAKYCSQRMLAIGLTLLVIAAVGGLVYATVVINGCQLTDGFFSYEICQRIFPVNSPGNAESPAHNYREITLPLATAPGWSGHSDAGKTYRITTTSGNSYFIPYKSTAEWDAFKAHKPANLSLCKKIPGNPCCQTWEQYCDSLYHASGSFSSRGNSYTSNRGTQEDCRNGGCRVGGSAYAYHTSGVFNLTCLPLTSSPQNTCR